MAKLYVFGIGGTGSRVLKSLTMLLAAGVDINVSEIVPIVIDPDIAAADMTRTVNLMKEYNKVYDKIGQHSSSKNKFFRTKINLDIIPGIKMPLKKIEDTTFEEYIGLSNMKDGQGNFDANYALTQMLFSQKNLDSTMEVGFKGNPNIGSVVLNQFTGSAEFNDFTASFGQNDKIFIVSSIFGGTGASGFPLLLKNLRAISGTQSGSGNIKDAIIGAISVLPYFDVKPDNNPEEEKRSEIDSSTFVSKTKAALSYYERNMNEANALYYVADDITKQYENSEGGATQRNDAHFIELASALAIIDFVNNEADHLNTINGVPQNIIHKEFGVENDSTHLCFSDMADSTNSLIKKPLTIFTLMCKYFNEHINDSLHQPWAKDHEFDKNFVDSLGKWGLKGVCKDYIEWLEEMSQNNRAFKPFNLKENKKDLFSLIVGEKPARKFSFKKNYALYDNYLNKKQRDIKKDGSKEHFFVELFYQAIEELVKSKFRM